ncbi:hypothetical protein D3C75_677250 [compost metagenome]
MITTNGYIITTNEEEAEMMLVKEVLFEQLKVTKNRLYNIHRTYYPIAEGISDYGNGEMYILDDLGRQIYGFSMLCKKVYYKFN